MDRWKGEEQQLLGGVLDMQVGEPREDSTTQALWRKAAIDHSKRRVGAKDRRGTPLRLLYWTLIRNALSGGEEEVGWQ